MSDFKTLLAVVDIMNKQIFSINEKDSILSCAKKMASEDVNSLLVTDGNDTLKGIVTEQDIVRRAVSKELDLSSDSVSSIMISDPLKINHDESIFEARNLMKNKNVNHMIVVKEEKPVGILTAANVMGS